MGRNVFYDDDRCKCEKQLNSSILRRFFREMIYDHFWSKYSDLTRPHTKR